MPENKLKSTNSRSRISFFYMIIVLMFVEILDTYTTVFPTVIPSRIINEFLGGYPENVANSIMAIAIGIATVGTYFVFINQFLADKFGRKILLVFTVFGMGFSSLLLFFSTSIIDFTIYLFLLYIFFSSDIWTIYINEESPPEKRATWTNIILMGGIGGAIIVMICRSIFITNTYSYWRGMTYFAIFWGIPLSVLILLTFKETSKFREMKERKGAPKKTMKLLKNNLKILFKSSNRKGFIAILITSFIISFNYITKSLLESYLTSSPYITQDDATIIILIISLATFIGYIFTGIVADKLGRKLIFYMYALIQPISVIIIVIGTYIPINTLIIVSVGGGFAYITSQCLVVVIRIVTLEILPTEARGIGTGVKSLVAALGMTAGTLLSSPFILNLGLGITFIIFSIPYIIIIPLIYYNLKETKGIDLSSIKAEIK